MNQGVISIRDEGNERTQTEGRTRDTGALMESHYKVLGSFFG